MANAYEHPQLGSAESIRVLHLLPSRDPKAPLHCTLTEVDFGRGRSCSYEAVSYVWGDADPECHVSCSGLILPITKNCQAALRRFRLRLRIRTLWLDSVCIDQSSETERSEQVKKMGDIFSNAARVLVWLGDATEYSRRALKRMALFGPFKVAFGIHALYSIFKSFFDERNSLYYALSDLIDRPYFSRMWTMQELVLSRRALLFYGDASVSWDSFGKIFQQVLSVKLGSNNPFFKDTPDPSILNRVRAFSAQWSLSQYLKHNHLHRIHDPDLIRALLMEVLSNARSLQSKDPRDKINALYWMVKDLCRDFPQPSYSKPHAQIYREASLAVMSAYHPFPGILTLVNGSQRLSGQPSWVPDWSDPNPFWLPTCRAFYFGGDGRDLPIKPLRTSSSGMKLHLFGNEVTHVKCASTHAINHHASVSRTTLSTERDGTIAFFKLLYYGDIDRGESSVIEENSPTIQSDDWDFYCDLLSYTGCYIVPPHLAYDDPFFAPQDPLPPQDVSRDATPRKYGKGPSSKLFYIVLMLTAMAYPIYDKVRPHRPRAKENIPFDEAISDFFRGNRVPQQLLSDHRWPEVLNSRRFQMLMFIFMVQQTENGDFVFRLYEELSRLAFFITESGHFGAAFHTARGGDSVVLFQGSNQPMIVRPCGKAWTVVGPAYVHSEMAAQEWTLDGSELQEFILV